jgi:outer membrane lipoprotein-sorting protein
MRRLFLGLAVALSAAGLAAADDKAEAVVKKAIEAGGGADALNKYKAARLKMSGEVTIGGMDFEFTGTLVHSLPDRLRMDINLEIMGMKMVIHQVVKGESVKNSIKLGDTTLPDPGDTEKEELRLQAAMHEAEQLTPLLDAKKFDIKAADDEDVNGKKAAVVVVTPKAVNKEVKMYFDKTSWLLVKTAHKGVDNSNGAPAEVLEESYSSDFKKVNGIPVATKVVVHHDGKKFLTINMSDIEVLEKIDDKEFTIDD